MISKFTVLLRIAFANLFGSFLNVFVGAVLFFGAALLVVGGAVFGTLDRSLSKSVVGSVTGHLQVYSARSKEKIEVYGKFDGSDSNLAPMDNFASLKAQLLASPNVSSVVPEGTSAAMLTSGNTIDLTLEKLRGLYRTQKAGGAGALPPEEFKLQAESLKQHVRNIVSLLQKDMEKATDIGTKESIDKDDAAALVTAGSDPFWADFDSDPYGKLELLENKIAPQIADGDLLFIRYLGTDLEGYQKTFDRLQIVEGTAVPKGRRGVLLPRYFYEEYMKLKNARRLDKMRDAREAGRKLSDESDKELQRFQRENITQTKEMVLQLDGLQTKMAVEKLQKLLDSKETDLAALLPVFFKVTDANFDQRYLFFYKELAPMLSLYRVKVGDTMTLRSFGRSGSLETSAVKLYGIFEFNGLEKSPLAGAAALLDMVSFRELYGFLTSDKEAELKAMKAQTQAREVSRENAEADLFGGEAAVVVETKESKIEEIEKHTGLRESAAEKEARVYSADEIDNGMVLHAAIMLKDGSPAAIAATQVELERLFAKTKKPVDVAALDAAQKLLDGKKLAFGLASALEPVLKGERERAAGKDGPNDAQLIALKDGLFGERAHLEPEQFKTIDKVVDNARPDVWVVGWSAAAGMLGSFIDVFRLILGFMVAGFALVALIVVTIGVTIATLQRTATIGTLRAIGAQREFVVSMVLTETIVLTLVFGTLGALAGAGVVTWLHASGIPAFRDELYFFFSGPSLKPDLDVASMVFSVATTLLVSLLAVLVPVILAIRVAPVTAMQSSES